jgi:hypothetical protein
MNDKIDTTINMVSSLKTGISHLTKELEKIQTHLEELRLAINSEKSESAAIKPDEIIVQKKKKVPVVVRREDQEIPEVVEPATYKIQVVGLGIQKLE